MDHMNLVSLTLQVPFEVIYKGCSMAFAIGEFHLNKAAYLYSPDRSIYFFTQKKIDKFPSSDSIRGVGPIVSLQLSFLHYWLVRTIGLHLNP